ncbi:[heparan sulfate]-glucosamine N-sulfotransferase [Aureococcus anophagefferens]|nr:[heparan sulfate]-glucosamine N-sulfotransferase [Aureococcus anophagefferens]
MLLNRIHARNEEIASQAQRHTADRSRHRRSFQTRLWLAGAALCTTLVLVLRDAAVAGRASPLSAPRVPGARRLRRRDGGPGPVRGREGHHARHGRFYEVSRPLPRSPAGAVVSAAPRRGCFRAAWTLDEAEGYVGDCAGRGDLSPLACAAGACAPETFDAYVRGATAPGGAVDVVADGDYAAQLSSIYGHFPRRQVHVLFFDDVVGDPLGVLDELQAAPNSTIQFDFNGRLGLPYHDFEPQLRRRKGRYDVAPLRTSLWDHALDALRPRRHRDAEAAPPGQGDARSSATTRRRPAPLAHARDHGDLRIRGPGRTGATRRRALPRAAIARVPSPGAQLTDEVP